MGGRTSRHKGVPGGNQPSGGGPRPPALGAPVLVPSGVGGLVGGKRCTTQFLLGDLEDAGDLRDEEKERAQARSAGGTLRGEPEEDP